MTSIEFIENKLNGFALQFPDYLFKYWLDDECGFHFVEVIPSDLKKKDMFRKEEIKIIKEFYSIYLDESIRFGSKNDLMFPEEYKLVNTFSQPYWIYVTERDNIFMNFDRVRQGFSKYNVFISYNSNENSCLNSLWYKADVLHLIDPLFNGQKSKQSA